MPKLLECYAATFASFYIVPGPLMQCHHKYKKFKTIYFCNLSFWKSKWESPRKYFLYVSRTLRTATFIPIIPKQGVNCVKDVGLFSILFNYYCYVSKKNCGVGRRQYIRLLRMFQTYFFGVHVRKTRWQFYADNYFLEKEIIHRVSTMCMYTILVH